MIPDLLGVGAVTAFPGDLARSHELDWLRANQDLVWFAALLGWSFALVLWRWNSPRGRAIAWLPWAAAAGVAGATVQFGLYHPPFGIFFARLVPGTTSTYAPAWVEPNVAGFHLLVATTALLCTAWGWQLIEVRRRSTLRWFTPLPPLAVAALHHAYPLVGASVLALGAVALAYVLGRRSGTPPPARWAIAAVGLAPCFSTYGPLAAATDSLHRSGPPTPLGLLAAFWQVGSALLALLVLLRRRAATGDPEEPLGRPTGARPYLLAATAWCIVGLAFSLRSASDQREELLQNRLRRAAASAKALEPALLAPLAAAEFHLPAPSAAPASARPTTTLVAGLPNGPADPLVRELARIVRTTPYLSVARIVVLRDGWLVAAASNQPAGPPGTVQLLRPATAADRAHAEARASYVESAAVPDFDRPFYCRGAVTGADGRLFAWLEFTQTESYMSSLRRFRAAPLLITALGLTLIAGAFLQRRQSRAHEAALRAAAVAAETNRLKTELLAKVSHELRTPLQGLLSYAELLEDEVVSAGGRTRVATLRQIGHSMLRLVNDLIDLSALEAGGFRFVEKPAAVSILVRDTVESLRPLAAAKGLALSCTVAPDFPPWLTLDGERFRQVLLNLAGNAVKFTDRGHVAVSLAARATDPADGYLLELAVRDTGPGIAPADQARLFQPFSRLDSTAQKEGSGLGLALAAGLCRRAGGALSLESDGRTGSLFRATFRTRLASPPPPRAGSRPPPSLLGHRLLIVDDNALVRDLFAAGLSRLGASCVLAADGEEAIKRARTGHFAAVVLDLSMPRLDGLAVTRRLRAAGRTTRIVGVSAHASDADRTIARAAGMDAFLTKPVELADLAAALAPADAPADAAPPARVFDDAPLLASLTARFRTQVPDDVARLRAAWQARDWPSLRFHAHYLRSSAGAIGDLRLYDLCGGLEQAAKAHDAGAAQSAWADCEAALAPWLT
jgi:signal transduction histidine kinase/CheY-like chemotaxis protein